jgi:hypothetical protein
MFAPTLISIIGSISVFGCITFLYIGLLQGFAEDYSPGTVGGKQVGDDFMITLSKGFISWTVKDSAGMWSVPSLNEYGMLILFIVLAGFSVKHLREKDITKFYKSDAK